MLRLDWDAIKRVGGGDSDDDFKRTRKSSTGVGHAPLLSSDFLGAGEEEEDGVPLLLGE